MSDLNPSPRELEILKVLWELGESGVRAVHERLAKIAPLAFNTVQTQLRIMEDKGLVAHRADGRTFVYRPKYTREKLSKRFLQKVFGGAVDELVLTMLAAKPLSSQELRELEELIAEHRRQKQAAKQEDQS